MTDEAQHLDLQAQLLDAADHELPSLSRDAHRRLGYRHEVLLESYVELGRKEGDAGRRGRRAAVRVPFDDGEEGIALANDSDGLIDYAWSVDVVRAFRVARWLRAGGGRLVGVTGVGGGVTTAARRRRCTSHGIFKIRTKRAALRFPHTRQPLKVL
ncbi:hypothetical protein [Streptomyces sp. MUSC 93]|uniref:Uncharacterized protein n=1 Tax=Streptomyces colonosanans TaxID=1428652 RepID=A0A1S2P7P4_9ACTN|nr:hypothetical protein BIV24_18980 [Streptomyces colonosanans]